MRKRNKKSRRNRQHGNGAFGRRALNIEQLEARRMMTDAADLAWLNTECSEDADCANFARNFRVSDTGPVTLAVYKWAVENKLIGPQQGAVGFKEKLMIEERLEKEQHLDNARFFVEEALDEAASGMEEAPGAGDGGDNNSPGWHTGFLGIPYYNLETTTSDGDNEGGITWAWEDGDGESEHGAIDEDDKLIWAWDDEEENEGSDGNGQGQKDDKSKGDEEDGLTWASWLTGDDDEDDDDDDQQSDDGAEEGDGEEGDEEENGDSQSRQTEDSRDSDPRRGGNGPDPRQGGLGRPGAGNSTDPAPYRGVIVQGGNSDPSDPESTPKGPGAAPDHPSYGAIDYGPDGKPVSYQGYLPPKDMLVQGGDIDPPKNGEHLAVDALFSQIGNQHAGSATNAAVTVASKSVDLGGNLPTFRPRK